MRHISDLLNKFGRLSKSNPQIEKKFIDLVDREFGVSLSMDDVRFKRGKIQVLASPIIRSKLIRRKDDLLTKLRENNSLRVTDII